MKNALYFIAIILVFACTSVPSLDNFDRQLWIEDSNGCSSRRISQVASLLEQEDKILGLKDLEVMELLGQPDETNLYQRTQRFLVYYLAPGPKCDSSNSNPDRIEIRISALNTVNEITRYP